MKEMQPCSVAFSPNGKWLAIGTETNQIVLWETKDWKWISTISSPSHVWRMQFSPDSALLMVGFVALDDGSGGSCVIDTRRWRELHRYRGHSYGAGVIALTNTHAVSAGILQGVEKVPFPGASVRDVVGWEARIWEPRTGKDLGQIEVRTGSCIYWITVSSDGKLLAVGDWDGTVTLWNLSTRRQLAEIPSGEFCGTTSGAFSPDAQYLLVTMQIPVTTRVLKSRILHWSVPELLEAGPRTTRIRFD